jgi:hypothetical protein
MTAKIDLRLDTKNRREPGGTEISRKPSGARRPHRVLWLVVLLIAMALAGVVGVVVAANVTNPPEPTPVVYEEPNANEREGRVPTTAAQVPNANEREGRVPTTAAPGAQRQRARRPSPGQQLARHHISPHVLAFAPT